MELPSKYIKIKPIELIILRKDITDAISLVNKKSYWEDEELYNILLTMLNRVNSFVKSE